MYPFPQSCRRPNIVNGNNQSTHSTQPQEPSLWRQHKDRFCLGMKILSRDGEKERGAFLICQKGFAFYPLWVPTGGLCFPPPFLMLGCVCLRWKLQKFNFKMDCESVISIFAAKYQDELSPPSHSFSVSHKNAGNFWAHTRTQTPVHTTHPYTHIQLGALRLGKRKLTRCGQLSLAKCPDKTCPEVGPEWRGREREREGGEGSFMHGACLHT